MRHKIQDLVRALEAVAPSSLQESYDNSGLLVGRWEQEVSQAMLCLDCTEEVV
ncbi:MAG: Nif3-like dinuclear metal center hexameric protein, partial [Bacteroidia bacterium]